MKKTFKRVLSLALAFCMILGLTCINVYATGGTETETTAADTIEDASYRYSIVHLDNGRKYYSVSSIETIIDNAAEAGFNYIELAVGNDGMRFLLDDMSLSFTVNGTEYSYESESVSSAIHTGNEVYYNEKTDELTESDMDTIIAYAAQKGVGIIPCVNTPGHMDAILDAGEELTGETLSYNGSGRTIDVTNEMAVAFTQAFLQKYISYFAGKGCTVFNMGADEYANDVYTSGSMGFGALQKADQYSYYVEYVNEVAELIKDAGMTPMAFNDGIYFNNDTSSGTFDTDIMIAYWSSGWSGYTVASASTLAGYGFKMINTHGDYYWIVGGSQCSVSTASNFVYTSFQGGTISDPAGAMFCIWSDYPGAMTDTAVASQTAAVIAAFGATLPDTGSSASSEDASITDDSTGVTVTAAGLEAVTVEGVTEPSVEGASAYDITLTADSGAYTGEAEVTLPIPEGWDTALVRGYVAASDAGEAVTGITGKVSTADGTNYFTFTVPHFSEVGIYLTSEDGDVSDEVDVTDYETVTVSVGGTATATISGANYAGTYSTENTGIATVEVTGSDAQESTVTYTQASSVKVSTLASSNVTYESTSYYCTPDGTNYYPLYVTRTSGLGNYTYTYYYSTDGGSTYTQIGNSQSVSSWSTNNTNASITLYTQTGTAAVDASTTVTFTGVKVGTTYVTVGNTLYTINVIAEDLSSVTGLTVEFWITNGRVTVDGSTSMEISAADAYGEEGVLISSLVSSTGSYNNSEVTYWKTTCLAYGNHQLATTDSSSNAGDSSDKTLSGSDFTYIRYYDGSWSYSSDGSTWTVIDTDSTSDQIVAYYLQVTDVTDEITTEVVDWGTNTSDGSYLSNQFVLLDFAVQYESGERVPTSFSASSTTNNIYHCVYSNGSTVVEQDGDGNYYRNIGLIRAEETTEYEVYMITLTPSSDTISDAVANSVSALNGITYTYGGTEKVVWVIDEETLSTTDFADESLWYTNVAGDCELTYGGDAVVSHLEIYRSQGMLVTYYIRAKQTEDSLTVNYVDETSGSQFYSYSIAVKSGITFDSEIELDDDGNVVNGDVTNKQDVTQTVSSDLSTLAAVSALYKNSDYTCVRLELSGDGKTVTLYYNFNTTASFVVDFGLPVNIKASDILEDSKITAVVGTDATLEDDGTVTWQADSVMDGVQSFSATVSVTENDKTVSRTYTVYMIPATTVYYEEGFASYGNGWDLSREGSWSNTTNKGTTAQTTEIAGEHTNNYGYDPAYDNNTTGSSNTAAATTTRGDTLQFSFTGTGVDLFANITDETDVAIVRVQDSDGNNVRMLTINTKVTGSYALVGTSYDTPIASVTGMDYGTYTVTIYLSTAGSSNGFRFDGFRVYDTVNTASVTSVAELYTNDLEDSPAYYELRNAVFAGLNVTSTSSAYAKDIAASTYAQVFASGETGTGAIVIYDGGSESESVDVQSLLDDGPKNELLLKEGMTVIFKLNSDRQAQIGLRAMGGSSATYMISDGSETDATTTLKSNVDMFYDLQEKDTTSGTVYTIMVTEGTLAITDIKFSDSTGETVFGKLTEADLTAALISMGYEDDADEADEAVYADASLTVNLVDYTGSVLSSTDLSATGAEGESATFAADDILEAVNSILPNGYALVNEDLISDTSVNYGDSAAMNVQIGKVATLEVTYQKYSGLFKKTTVGTVTLTKVQTSSDSKATFSVSEIRAAVPDGYKILLATSSSVSYGSAATKTVTVY